MQVNDESAEYFCISSCLMAAVSQYQESHCKYGVTYLTAAGILVKFSCTKGGILQVLLPVCDFGFQTFANRSDVQFILELHLHLQTI